MIYTFQSISTLIHDDSKNLRRKNMRLKFDLCGWSSTPHVIVSPQSSLLPHCLFQFIQLVTTKMNKTVSRPNVSWELAWFKDERYRSWYHCIWSSQSLVWIWCVGQSEVRLVVLHIYAPRSMRDARQHSGRMCNHATMLSHFSSQLFYATSYSPPFCKQLMLNRIVISKATMITMPNIEKMIY